MTNTETAEAPELPECAEPDTTPHPHWRRKVVVFVSGQSISLLGSSLVQYAISWYLLLETRSGLVMTLALLAGFIPQALVSVFGGVWADRVDRKRLAIDRKSVV